MSALSMNQGKPGMNENDMGVHDTMARGLFHVKTHLSASHPLEIQEMNRIKIEEEQLFSQMRMNQGLHAPLKFKMEFDTARKIGRLPCLKSSNLMLSVLKGTDDTLEVEDIFNNQKEFREYNIDPHVALESRKF